MTHITRELWQRVSPVLDQVLDAPPGARADLIERLCGSDGDVRAAVESLLRAEQRRPTVAEGPVDPFLVLIASTEDAVETGAPGPAEGAIVGHYRVVREIGRGGMGSVFLAERSDGQFEKQVALKIIRQDIGRAVTEQRFLDERRILARLENPHVARLLDGGVSPHGPFFVMEYAEGQPITTWCDTGRLTVEQRLRMFLQVCEAVSYAHRNLVVHRDIKPSNILVDGDGWVRLLDFGIAGMLSSSGAAEGANAERAGAAMTREYASPEQAMGEPAGTAADVYSLGMLLCELLAGGRAYGFDDASPDAVKRTICTREPMRPSDIVTAAADRAEHQGSAAAVAAARSTSPKRLQRLLAGDLDGIVIKALAKAPEKRFRFVDGFAADIERHLAGLPVESHAPTAAYRAGKFIRRHGRFVAGVAFVLIVILAAMMSTTREARRAADAADLAGAVRDFLVSIFEGSDPDNAGSADVTGRELLDRGAERIQTELTDRPQLQAELLLVIAEIYRTLGITVSAAPLADSALAFRERLYGRADPRVAAALNEAGWIRYVGGRYAVADSMVRLAVDMRRTALGPMHADLAKSLDNLSEIERAVGHYQDAESHAREALEMRRILLGDHRDVATSLNNLGVILRQLDRTAEAEELYREAAEMQVRLLGPDHTATMSTRMNLALVMRQLGRRAEAADTLRNILARQREKLGDDHPLTITCINNLAAISSELGRFDDAESLFREVLAYWEHRSPNHPNALTTLNNIAFVERAKGDLGEAEKLFREVYARSGSALGERHPTTIFVLYNLGGTLQRMGESREAERLFRRALAAGDDLVPTDQLVALLNGSLGRILAESSRCEEAVERLGPGVGVLSKLPAHAAGLVDLRLSLGNCLIALGRAGEAEQPLLAAFDALDDDDARRDAAARSLVTVFEATGDDRRADEFRAAATGPSGS